MLYSYTLLSLFLELFLTRKRFTSTTYVHPAPALNDFKVPRNIMKLFSLAATFLLGTSLASCFTLRSSRYAFIPHEATTEAELATTPLTERFDESLLSYLEKRRGGGGRSGGSSGSSSSSSSGSGSSGGRSGSGSSGGSRNTGTARLVIPRVAYVPGHNVNSSSSIATPSYGGGRYYGGGATTAYKSGGRSPLGLAPYAIGVATLGIFPGLWLAGAYGYNFNHPYYFHNATNTTDRRNNESLPVTCLCQKYQACGCDDNGNTTYIDELLGNGSTSDQNSTLVHVGNVNGSKTVVINGTLPNGTDDSSSTSGAMRQTVLELSGFWVVSAVVLATVFT